MFATHSNTFQLRSRNTIQEKMCLGLLFFRCFSPYLWCFTEITLTKIDPAGVFWKSWRMWIFSYTFHIGKTLEIWKFGKFCTTPDSSNGLWTIWHITIFFQLVNCIWLLHKLLTAFSHSYLYRSFGIWVLNSPPPPPPPKKNYIFIL